MIKAVILDVDGTLMDTNYLHVEAWAQAFKAEGYQVPRAEIHRQIGKGSRALITVFVQDEAVAPRIDELHSEFYAELQQRGYPLPGAKELIAALSEQGREVWFATSAKPKELEHHLKMLQAGDSLTGVVSSKDVENPKPAPDIFRLALKKAGCLPEEAIAVGDTVWDIEAARGAGLSTAAVLTGGGFSRGELDEAGAVAVYKDCAGMLEAGFPEL